MVGNLGDYFLNLHSHTHTHTHIHTHTHTHILTYTYEEGLLEYYERVIRMCVCVGVGEGGIISPPPSPCNNTVYILPVMVAQHTTAQQPLLLY